MRPLEAHLGHSDADGGHCTIAFAESSTGTLTQHRSGTNSSRSTAKPASRTHAISSRNFVLLVIVAGVNDCNLVRLTYFSNAAEDNPASKTFPVAVQ